MALGLAAVVLVSLGIALTAEIGAVELATDASTATVAGDPSATGSSEPNAIGNGSQFPVTIGKPSGPPRVDTGLTDLQGNQVTVACSTCHATREPNTDNESIKDMDEFHDKLTSSHGTATCLSCHNERDYDSLKLADGSRVEFTEVMTLCGQCHGPQMEAYQHGAHGGMTGHWDLTRGSRQKNNCVACHNPHTPQFPKMRPTFKPKDRFLEPPKAKH